MKKKGEHFLRNTKYIQKGFENIFKMIATTKNNEKSQTTIKNNNYFSNDISLKNNGEAHGDTHENFWGRHIF